MMLGKIKVGGLISLLIINMFLIISCTKIDVAKCEKFQSVGRKNFCYSALALKTGDTSYCQKTIGIDGDIDKVVVAADCISRVAMDKDDVPICDQISDKLYKDACYSDVSKQ